MFDRKIGMGESLFNIDIVLVYNINTIDVFKIA